MTRAITLVLVLTSGLVCGCSNGNHVVTNDIEIEGIVVDEDHKPLAKVSVIASQTNFRVETAESDKDGSYRLTLPAGTDIVAVEFAKKGMDPGIIQNLCGTRSHSITKVLYVAGKKRPLSAAMEQLHAYRVILALHLESKESRPLKGQGYSIAIDKLTIKETNIGSQQLFEKEKTTILEAIRNAEK